MGQALSQDQTAQDRAFVLELVGCSERTEAFFRFDERVAHFLRFYRLAKCEPQTKGENETFFREYCDCFAVRA